MLLGVNFDKDDKKKTSMNISNMLAGQAKKKQMSVEG
jgi:hypothetical protein